MCRRDGWPGGVSRPALVDSAFGLGGHQRLAGHFRVRSLRSVGGDLAPLDESSDEAPLLVIEVLFVDAVAVANAQHLPVQMMLRVFIRPEIITFRHDPPQSGKTSLMHLLME
jgi:hypothetical protein